METLDLTGRLGYSFAEEFEHYFLIENRLISGCCQPPEYLLFDKTTGNELVNFGSLVFYSSNRKFPVIVYFTDSTYNSFTIYNLEKKTKKNIPLVQDQISNTLEIKSEIFPEHLLSKTEIEGDFLVIEYEVISNELSLESYTKTMKINLNDID